MKLMKSSLERIVWLSPEWPACGHGLPGTEQNSKGHHRRYRCCYSNDHRNYRIRLCKCSRDHLSRSTDSGRCQRQAPRRERLLLRCNTPAHRINSQETEKRYDPLTRGSYTVLLFVPCSIVSDFLRAFGKENAVNRPIIANIAPIAAPPDVYSIAHQLFGICISEYISETFFSSCANPCLTSFGAVISIASP